MMELDELSLPAKPQKLVYAALNLTPKEIAEVCARLGKPEYSAPALGLACRFRGVDCVKALFIKKFKNPLDKIKQMVYNYLVNKAESPHSHPPTDGKVKSGAVV